MNTTGTTQHKKFLQICHSDSPKTSILIVVEDGGTAKKIKEGMNAESTARFSCLQVHMCESIDQLLLSEHSIQSDYVVFVINLHNFQVLKKVADSLKKLSKAFLLDRTCLVVDTSQEAYHSLAADILTFKQKYQLHVLWGNVETQCSELCQRLFTLVTAICGTFTGFPLIAIQDRYTPSENA